MELVPLAQAPEVQQGEPAGPLSFECQRARWTAHDLKGLDIRCTWCKALHWEAELGSSKAQAGEASFESCCKHGQVGIESMCPLPEPLNTLMNGQDAQPRLFQERHWKWNSIFAYTSILFNKDSRTNEIGGNFQLFQIHGAMYHRQGPLEPAGRHVDARFSQVYLDDPAEAARLRAVDANGLNPNLILSLTMILQRSNPLIQLYLTAREYRQRSVRREGMPARSSIHNLPWLWQEELIEDQRTYQWEMKSP